MGTKIENQTKNCGLENECKEIHGSWGSTRLNQLLKSLATKSKIERQQIRETYKAMYGQDITSLLSSSFSCSRRNNNDGNGGKDWQVKPCVLWMVDPHERDAIVAREALDHREQGDINYMALVEILVGRKWSHILLIEQAYHAKFRRKLDQDIISIEPPNPYQKILLALIASHKAHQVEISHHIAKCDAKRLHEAGEASSGGAIEEAVVLEILSKRSLPQMKITFSSYYHIYGHEYNKSLKGGYCNEFEDALRNVIKCMCNPSYYYAKALYEGINGTCDKGTLVRVLVSRADVDIGDIQRIFKEKYGFELRDAICDRIPPGDYRDFLVALASESTLLEPK